VGWVVVVVNVPLGLVSWPKWGFLYKMGLGKKAYLVGRKVEEEKEPPL